MELLKTRLIDGDPLVLEVEGEMDVSTADELRAAMETALSKSPNVVVDMAGVTFCDAGGLRAVLEVAAKLNGSGPLTLLNASRVKWLLDLVGMNASPTIVIRNEDGSSDR